MNRTPRGRFQREPSTYGDKKLTGNHIAQTIGATEMSLQDFLKVCRERWPIIAVAVLVGAISACAFFLIRPAQYTATTSLYVSSQTGNDASQAFQGAQLSEQRVKSYNEIIVGPRVIGDAAGLLQSGRTPAELAREVTASSSLDSVVINVAATDRSPDQAARIANTVASVATGVVDELERPNTAAGSSPVVLRVIQPAAVPATPSSIGLPALVTVGLLLGLVLGIGIALTRNALDTTVKSPEALDRWSGAANLGFVPFDTDIATPLAAQFERPTPGFEPFRQIRTNLNFIDVDSPRKVLVVTSALPAEGKTTTVANLARAISAAGTNLLVIEADLRRPSLSSMFGLDNIVGLTSVLSGTATLNQAIQQGSGGAFDVLASGRIPPNPSELLASQQMRRLLDDVRNKYDVILIDTPPLLPVTDAAALAPHTDGVILVCRFKQTTQRQIEGAAASLRSVSVEPLGTILTMVPSSGSTAYGHYNSYYPSISDSQTVRDRPAGGNEDTAKLHAGTHGTPSRVDASNDKPRRKPEPTRWSSTNLGPNRRQ